MKVILQEKVFRSRHSRNKNCLPRPCLSTDRDKIINHYTKDTVRSVSYLDLHIEIDNEWRLRSKHYDKRDDFNFPIVNFPFLCSNIPASSAYGIYLSHLIRYSRTCGSYQDFLGRGLLLTRKLPNQIVFSRVRVTQSLVLCQCVCFVDRCLSFCIFYFGHCVVCSSSIYRF